MLVLPSAAVMPARLCGPFYRLHTRSSVARSESCMLLVRWVDVCLGWWETDHDQPSEERWHTLHWSFDTVPGDTPPPDIRRHRLCVMVLLMMVLSVCGPALAVHLVKAGTSRDGVSHVRLWLGSSNKYVAGHPYYDPALECEVCGRFVSEAQCS
eukprot:COSAG01_NODE_6011_length_3902_cov_10.567447_4_plen_154_part_00